MSDHNNNDNTKVIKCRYCGKRIAFDDRKVSKNGIKIPLDYDTLIPHECPLRNQGTLKPHTQRIDKDFENINSVSYNHDLLANQILNDVKKGREEHNQIGIDLYHLTNEIDEIKQILKDLTSKLSSSSFDENRYR